MATAHFFLELDAFIARFTTPPNRLPFLPVLRKKIRGCSVSGKL